MKKWIILVLLFAFGTVQAQNALDKGQFQFNGGVGLSSWGLPIYLGLDYGITEDITIGGEMSFRSYQDHWSGLPYRHSIIGFAGNGNYHFNNLLSIPENWDFYAGLNLGFFIWNSPETYGGSGASGLGFGGQVGGRYYFNEKLGVNVEFGGGNASTGGKLGISVRL
jgi:hypothetical protein